ncbi:MAG: Replicative DNA helicase [Candidatus Curtissbacteria bacterium GW2011_GWA1_40_47]|nr:MAG: Replicative DNA helicase [Candidatus Curtissbacteria bacterium GW2011_GWB1_40_28]KKR59753.1 MAG: Replicative DNA helicase [Candidatus Curtissbacteria bacterium GW2011_GWA2_40_31]KKR61948.1 MAG: Replicative DNA helicase [Microgenomates group bacterium GW2011_GWC1_40_35]KKR64873.1 MAG: Replicative DNA helicase [Candidatus Curtissbacteria bacterium GW2011_GWA1_40_47]KKS00387.1 MAG: Replicative DNA helicase [Candidatus Curtissbacteria bacterium GW2011_GWC2_41_21]OGD78908.1 MAG: replicative
MAKVQTSRQVTTGRIPPQDLEAEKSIIGAILIDKDAIVAVISVLKSEYFYKQAHSDIFQAICDLYERREPVDLVTLTAQLKKRGVFDEVGGTAYLAELGSAVPTAANIVQYAQFVREAHIKRRLIATSAKVTQSAFDETADIRTILDETEQAVFALSQEQLRQNFMPIKDALAESFDRLDELHKKAGGLRGVSTGFWDLDAKLAGMQDSNLLILASRPGQGKTSLALNIAAHVAVNDGLPVGIFSLEMSKEELVDRLLVSQSEIDAWKLKTGKLDDEDFDRLQEAMGVLADAPLFIDDTPAASILEMRTKARRLQVEHNLSFLIVDYLQLVQGRRMENRVQEVSEISQNLKNLARELKIPVLACSQLSRAVEQRGTKKPQLADLRESGAIEQDADVVMFIWRPDADNMEQVKLDIQKHRNGPTGEIDMTFRADRVKFYGVEKQRRQVPPPPQAVAEA